MAHRHEGLVSQPGIEPQPPALGAWSFNHWTLPHPRKFLALRILRNSHRPQEQYFPLGSCLLSIPSRGRMPCSLLSKLPAGETTGLDTQTQAPEVTEDFRTRSPSSKDY